MRFYIRMEVSHELDGEGKMKHGASSKWYEYEGLTVHDFRRSALSNMTEAGVSVPDAMSISGHKTVSTSSATTSSAMRKVEDMAAAKRKSPRTKGI